MNKDILWIFPEGGMCGEIRFWSHKLPFHDRIDFLYLQSDFCYTILPKDLSDSEILRSSDSLVWFRQEDFGWGLQFLSSDLSRYKQIVVWNNMTTSAILMLYLVCYNTDCEVYELNVKEIDISGVHTVNEPLRDYSDLMGKERLISNEERRHYASIWYDLARMPQSPRISHGYEIEAIDNELIYSRIMAHVNKRYKLARKVTYEAMDENRFESYFPMYYYEMNAWELVKQGKLKIRQKKFTPNEYYEDIYPRVNGVDVNENYGYELKLV